MQTLVFDIETNGIIDFRTLDEVRVIHCIAISDTRNEEVLTFNTQEGNIEEGLELLRLADVIVGHNVQNFDIPAIKRLHPKWQPEGRVLDTLILARLVYPDRRNDDYVVEELPKKMRGSHSLASWGFRLGCLKGEYGSDMDDWENWSPEMEKYCAQDVRTTKVLFSHLGDSVDLSIEAVEIEHTFSLFMYEQWKNGIGFDAAAAGKLYGKLRAALIEIEDKLQEIFPPKEEPMKTRAYWIADNGTTHKTKKVAVEAGHNGLLLKPGPYRVKKTPFNPGSRLMIANAFIEKYGWRPIEFTPEGRPRVDEVILRGLPYPEAAPLSEYLMLTKRIGQLADGNEAWLRIEADGRIFGRVNTNGAVTGRCTHSRPNLAQVPNAHAPWGPECRALFIPEKGNVLVGVDASGLELRCLAHYMAKYDNGAYATEILEGDIHTANQNAAGLPTRNKSKTFIYAFLYGAGDAKIGSIVGGGRREGRRLKKQFLDRTPALRQLKVAVELAVDTRGHLVGIDGRALKIRSKHSALNTLLQSAGAVAVKKATILMNQAFIREGLEVKQVAHVHDEVQFECAPDIADKVGGLAVTAIQEAGLFFNFRCPLDGEYSIGNNWYETH